MPYLDCSTLRRRRPADREDQANIRELCEDRAVRRSDESAMQWPRERRSLLQMVDPRASSSTTNPAGSAWAVTRYSPQIQCRERYRSHLIQNPIHQQTVGVSPANNPSHRRVLSLCNSTRPRTTSARLRREGPAPPDSRLTGSVKEAIPLRLIPRPARQHLLPRQRLHRLSQLEVHRPSHPPPADPPSRHHRGSATLSRTATHPTPAT